MKLPGAGATVHGISQCHNAMSFIGSSRSLWTTQGHANHEAPCPMGALNNMQGKLGDNSGQGQNRTADMVIFRTVV